MGCCGSKPSAQPLKKETKQIKFEDNGHSHSRKNQAPIQNALPTASEIVQNKPLEQINQQQQQLNLSGKPGWNGQSEFINIAEVQQQPIDSSPIQIIYSSDHENKQPTYSQIKKNLFKDRPLENSVIHEVPQQNVESQVHQKQGSSEKMPKRLKQSDKIIEDAIKEEQIKIFPQQGLDVLGEEQIAERFQFRLPKIQIFPAFAHT